MEICKKTAALSQYYKSYTSQGGGAGGGGNENNSLYKVVLERKNIFAAYNGGGGVGVPLSVVTKPSSSSSSSINNSSSSSVVDTTLQKIHSYVNEIMPMLCRVLLPLYGKPSSFSTEPGPLQVPMGYICGKMYRFIGNSMEKDEQSDTKGMKNGIDVYPIPKGCNLYVQCFRNSSYETIALDASSKCVIDMENNAQMGE